jgi:hypothetical protein
MKYEGRPKRVGRLLALPRRFGHLLNRPILRDVLIVIRPWSASPRLGLFSVRVYRIRCVPLYVEMLLNLLYLLLQLA